MKSEGKTENTFPRWKPQKYTIKKFGSENFRERYSALKSSSAAFVHKKEVRDYIFKKYNNKCYICGSTENLQIDHIISICRFADKRLPWRELNSEENLAAICPRCNSSKQP